MKWWRRSDAEDREAVVERLEDVADNLEQITLQLRKKVERLRLVEEQGNGSHGR